MLSNPSRHYQLGFTLLELMVVVVILAILLSFAIVSLKPNQSAELRKQTVAFKGALITICDQSAFDQHIYALIPSKKGIQIQRLVKGSWQASGLKMVNESSLNWNEAITVSWDLNDELAKSYGLKQAGWMCWPSGEVNAGSISFKLNELSHDLQWNEILDFTLKEKDASQE